MQKYTNNYNYSKILIPLAREGGRKVFYKSFQSKVKVFPSTSHFVALGTSEKLTFRSEHDKVRRAQGNFFFGLVETLKSFITFYSWVVKCANLLAYMRGNA
ncbi:MAG: hypothetical protein Crog4KO_36770 [Crocinitomicaceae bacterium]